MVVVLTLLSILYVCVFMRHLVIVHGTSGMSSIFVRHVHSCIGASRLGSTVGCYHITGAPTSGVVRGKLRHVSHPTTRIRTTLRGTNGLRVTGLRGKLSIVTAVSSKTPVVNFLNAILNVIGTF